MLPDLHESIRRMLYERGRISPAEVDIRFDAPRKEWIDRLMRPTINLHLFDIFENLQRRSTQMQARIVNGHAERHMAPRQMDLRYMVSAITSEIEDEHLLLWRTLSTLMKYQEIPDDYLPSELQRQSPRVVSHIGQPDDDVHMGQVWTGLNVEARPALCYVVTVPLDLEWSLSAPLVLTRSTRYIREPDGVAAGSFTAIGGTVRDAAGEPVAGVLVHVRGSAADPTRTGDDGRFRLRRLPFGAVTLDVTAPDGNAQAVTIEVPSDSYDVVLE